jgi:DNA-directed RNA polymerase specialized sigma24 family protein
MLKQGAIAVMDKGRPNELLSEKLFCRLYKWYFGKAFNDALSYCGTKDMAEDCVQDVFLKVWENIHQYQAKLKIGMNGILSCL